MATRISLACFSDYSLPALRRSDSENALSRAVNRVVKGPTRYPIDSFGGK
jgi:hypothetical protein